MAYQIPHNCPNCNNVTPVPAQYIGRIKCHKCKHTFQTKGQLHEQRQYLLKKLADLKATGFQYVRWCTGKDELVCLLCSERDGRLFKLEEVKELIRGKFCQAKDFWQGCRCIIVAAKIP